MDFTHGLDNNIISEKTTSKKGVKVQMSVSHGEWYQREITLCQKMFLSTLDLTTDNAI